MPLEKGHCEEVAKGFNQLKRLEVHTPSTQVITNEEMALRKAEASGESEDYVAFDPICGPGETNGCILAHQLVLSGLLSTLIKTKVVGREQAEDILRIATFRNDFVCDNLLSEGRPADEVDRIRQHCGHILDLMYKDM